MKIRVDIRNEKRSQDETLLKRWWYGSRCML